MSRRRSGEAETAAGRRCQKAVPQRIETLKDKKKKQGRIGRFQEGPNLPGDDRMVSVSRRGEDGRGALFLAEGDRNDGTTRRRSGKTKRHLALKGKRTNGRKGKIPQRGPKKAPVLQRRVFSPRASSAGSLGGAGCFFRPRRQTKKLGGGNEVFALRLTQNADPVEGKGDAPGWKREKHARLGKPPMSSATGKRFQSGENRSLDRG